MFSEYQYRSQRLEIIDYDERLIGAVPKESASFVNCLQNKTKGTLHCGAASVCPAGSSEGRNV